MPKVTKFNQTKEAPNLKREIFHTVDGDKVTMYRFVFETVALGYEYKLGGESHFRLFEPIAYRNGTYSKDTYLAFDWEEQTSVRFQKLSTSLKELEDFKAGKIKYDTDKFNWEYISVAFLEENNFQDNQWDGEECNCAGQTVRLKGRELDADESLGKVNGNWILITEYDHKRDRKLVNVSFKPSE